MANGTVHGGRGLSRGEARNGGSDWIRRDSSWKAWRRLVREGRMEEKHLEGEGALGEGRLEKDEPRGYRYCRGTISSQ